MRKVFILLIIASFLIGLISFSFAEEDIITYEKLNNYSEYYSYNETTRRGEDKVKIEVIIGDVREYSITYTDLSGVFHSSEPLYEFDYWVLGDNGYIYTLEESMPHDEKYPFELKKGSRLIITLLPYADGSYGPKQIVSYELIDSNYDVDALRAEYLKATYQPYPSTKKFLRNPENYKGYQVFVKGTIIKQIDMPEWNGFDFRMRKSGLIEDEEGEVYYFSYGIGNVNDNLLLGDNVIIYGGISRTNIDTDDGVVTYPAVWVYFIDLLEDE